MDPLPSPFFRGFPRGKLEKLRRPSVSSRAPLSFSRRGNERERRQRPNRTRHLLARASVICVLDIAGPRSQILARDITHSCTLSSLYTPLFPNRALCPPRNTCTSSRDQRNRLARRYRANSRRCEFVFPRRSSSLMN